MDIKLNIQERGAARNSVDVRLSLAEEHEGFVDLVVSEVEFSDDATAHFRDVMLSHLVGVRHYHRGMTTEQLFPGWSKNGYDIAITGDVDVSFGAFWDGYGKKIGAKARCEKKWEKLQESDKVLAMLGIKKMRRYYNEHRLDVPYPETYIDQRRWENEFS